MRFSRLATRPTGMCLPSESPSGLRSGFECQPTICCRNSVLTSQSRYAGSPSYSKGAPRQSSATPVPAPCSYANAAIRCLRTVACRSMRIGQLHTLRHGCAANNRLQPPAWPHSPLRSAMVCSTAVSPQSGRRHSRISDSRPTSLIDAQRSLHQCQLFFVSARAAALLTRNRSAPASVVASQGPADGPLASNLRETSLATPHGARGHQDEPSNSAAETIVHDAGSKRLEMLRQSVVQDLQAVQEQEEQRAASRTLRVRLATSFRIAFQTYYTVNLLAVTLTAQHRWHVYQHQITTTCTFTLHIWMYDRCSKERTPKF